MSTVKVLSNGVSMPLVGLGTWQSPPGAVKQAVISAIDAGYRHIDCAMCYGNEKEVGEGLSERIGSVIQRHEIFVTSKLWNTMHKPEDVLPACKKTLADLGLEYLDLYLIHWPISFENANPPGEFAVLFPKHPDGTMRYASVAIEDTWHAMEQLVEQGLVKAIGLSNFNASQVTRIATCAKISPVVNQVECHPLLNQSRLLSHCAQYNISLVAHSPLANGRPQILDNAIVKKIAEAHAKSPAQVPNIKFFEMGELVGLDTNTRTCVPTIEVNGQRIARDEAHPDFPFLSDF
eukprot:c10296_g1_i2.p1 GENE.c10296_g1_i2~~c10296_g1_i2.p1  ORF type:complete len:291 (+),score=62.84 c10296_g1_i2:27-899(+)